MGNLARFRKGNQSLTNASSTACNNMQKLQQKAGKRLKKSIAIVEEMEKTGVFIGTIFQRRAQSVQRTIVEIATRREAERQERLDQWDNYHAW